MYRAMTALGACAEDPRDGDEADERRVEAFVLGLCNEWAGRSGARRWKVGIFQLRRLGVPERELARRSHRSPRRIRQIVAEVRDGIRATYGRPIGEPVEEVLGVG